VTDKSLLPNAFALMKISEALGSMIITYMSGYVSEKTGGFSGVCSLFVFMSLMATVASYYYYQKKELD
jgi:predicted lipid-binding transport protein (Tim44 family)